MATILLMFWIWIIWFRCDDEHISFLSEGPESAFHRSHRHDNAQYTTRKMVAGTSDAYCLYYINKEWMVD
jgi:hypothetical protein